MKVTIRNQRVLRALGFSTVGSQSVVGLPVRGWADAIWFRLSYNYRFNREVVGMGIVGAIVWAWRHSDVFHITDARVTAQD